MRHRLILLVAALLPALAAPALGQTAPVPWGTPGHIDFGARSTSVSGDAARFQRYRDFGDGFFLDQLRYDRATRDWRFAFAADHVGRLDQRYAAELRDGGRLKVSFQWDQVPLFMSSASSTLYTAESPGVLRIADAIQQGIQTGGQTLANFAGQATRFDLRSRRDTGSVDMVYSVGQNVDAKFSLRSASRNGTMPYGATFGFSNDVELAAPIDTRTTDVRAGVEWASQRGSLRVGYDGSWFDNHVQTLVWDNPLVLTATAGAPSQGRMALWPSNTTHSVTTAGTFKLLRDSRVAGNITIGSWSQNEPLLPFSINSLSPAVQPLPRTTADASARTVAMNYSFTSRPNKYLWLNARFRYYDFDNRTPMFDITQYNRYDSTVSTLEHGPKPLGYVRHNVDLDASFTPTTFTAVRVGYGHDWTDRTHRIFERTTEDVARVSLDTTQFGWLTLRAIVENSVRKGEGFEEEELIEMGEQPLIRHFDVADRDRSRVTGLVQVEPRPEIGISFSAVAGEDDYKNSGMGLRDSRNRTYSATFDVTPGERVAAGASYTFERYDALQNSRSANRTPAQFDNPLRNWSLDSGDRVRTAGAWLDLLKVVPRTDIRFSYDFTRSRTTYVYSLASGSPLTVPVPLPPVTNKLVAGLFDTRYYLSERVAIGVVYRYDRYDVDDFAQSPATLNSVALPGSLFLGYLNQPYRAHSTWVRLTYFW